jgi:prepilin-type N-terminal cleavage/methylation domain-containing protein
MRIFKRLSNRKAGFTMLELLVVMAILAILMGILLPVLARARKEARKNAARQAMNAIMMALSKYQEEHRYYPPDDQFGGINSDPAGSQTIAWYLCRRLTVGDTTFGPYLTNIDSRLRDDGSGIKALISPLGGYYRYAYLKDTDGKQRRAIAVEAGMDQQWGGTLDQSNGFQPDGSDANTDSEADDLDNIYSTPPTQ